MTEFLLVPILVVAGLVVLSIFSTLVAFRFGAPLLLVFLGLGLLAGQDGPGGIQFENVEAAYLVGSVALAIILYDSGFATPARSLRLAARPAVVLATLGVLLTAGGVGLAAWWLLGLPIAIALLLGAIVASTDAAAVFFLLRAGGIEVRARVRSTLEVESGSNDPMAVFLTVVLVEFILAGGSREALGWTLVSGFGLQLVVGGLLGWLAGRLIVRVINSVELEAALYPVVALSLAIGTYALAGLLGGSGFLAAYVAGLVAGNRKVRAAQTLKRFHGGMTWLAQIGMFLTLGLLATPSEFPLVLWPALLLAAVLMLVARPLAVFLCLLPFRMPWREQVFIGWVGLRGAVSILLALVPALGALPEARTLFNIVFVLVLASLLVQGWTLKPLAKRLGLLVPPRLGPVERIELELPGVENHELVNYHLPQNCAVTRGARLPRWARPALVVREGRALRPHQAGEMRPDDHVYVFAHPEMVPLLDRLFASSKQVDPEDREFFGEFALAPTAGLADLGEYYGFAVPEGKRELTLAALFDREFAGKAEVGDRIPMGQIDLIVRAVNERGAVSEAGLLTHHREGESESS